MRWIWRGLMTILLLLALAVVAVFMVGRSSLPTIDGRIALDGLSGEVEIVRDRFAVPHIYASNRADAVFALGYVHAQDRLWQMELQRRIGAGRLSEFGGEVMLSTDIFLRTLGVYRAAEATLARLEPEAVRLLEAYAAGVNAFLGSRDGFLPPEFLILGIEPEPWRPADTLVWLKMMAWNLSGNWSDEIERARLAKRLTPAQIGDLWPPYPDDAPVALRDMAALIDLKPLSDLARLLPMRHEPGLGSNNWVVDGSRTATGKPLLANDPHLGLQAPSLWYLAHLDDGTDASIGATLPGVPVVVLGRNRRIAWGFTNTYPDTQDLYIEEVNPDDPSQYRTPDGWAAFKVREEVIRVKDADDVTIRVRSTRHGPVLSDVADYLDAIAEPGHVIAMQWHVLDDDEMTIQAGLKTHTARNWPEFLDAMADFDGAQQNMVYADVDGNIGFVAAGKVPIRADNSPDQGMMPRPGWDPAYDRIGFIPFDELPRTFNPAGGVVVTANNKIVGDGYPYFLTNEWDSPTRARRIEELLQARQVHSIESFKAIQADDVSLLARDLLPVMLKSEPASEVGRRVLAELSLWDGAMRADRVEPTIFHAWYRELVRQVMIDEAGDAFDGLFSFRAEFISNVLHDRNGAGRWCDDVATTETEDCRAILSRALDLALADLENRFGSDRSAWRWGVVHAAHSGHKPFTNVEPLSRFFDIEVPVSGGAFTVNRALHRIGDDEHPFRTVHGASLRAIYDLDNPDASLYMHSTGQSGHVLSSHYDDFAERWSRVDYIPMSMRRDEIEAGALGTLTLRRRR